MNSTDSSSYAFDDLFYGLSNMIFSLCGISIYAIVLKLLITAPDYKSLYAYWFMVHLGFTDILQLFVHFLAGLFVMTQWYFSPLLSRIFGALLSAWIPMLFFSGALATDRFMQILLPQYFSRIFNSRMMMVYLISGWLLFVVFSCACLSPFLWYGFVPGNFSWQFYGAWKPIVESINRDAEFVVVFGSGVMYCIILGFIWVKSIKMLHGFAVSFERRLTIQVMLICTFHTVLVLFWELGLQALPDTKIVWYISSFVWIIWCSFNPIIYLTFNSDLRCRFLVLIKIQKKPVETVIVHTAIRHDDRLSASNSTRSIRY